MVSDIARFMRSGRCAICLPVLAGAMLVLVPGIAGACSCVGGAGPSFLLKTGAVLPANTRGIPLEGGIPQSVRAAISVRLLDDTKLSIPFELEAISLPDGYSMTSHGYAPDALTLVSAKWQPGKSYRISIGNTSIDVSIDNDDFVPDSCTLVLSEERIGELTAVTLRGSCSVRFSAQQVDVLMSGKSVSRWGGSLLYLTIVDGSEAWRPSHNLCEDIPVGRSWVGTARELVYSACDEDREGRDVLWNLEAGAHEVLMIAWLPGVVMVTASATVSLGCDD